RMEFAWLSVAGVGFWFFVGFPFGNHNESYYWLARFQDHDAWDIVSTSTLAATFRPLGQGLASVGWQLSGGESWPVQHFIVAVGLLFHPYALILFLPYLAGCAGERWRESSFLEQTQRALLGLLVVFTLAASRPHGHEVLSNGNLRALLASYRLTEISPALSLL